ALLAGDRAEAMFAHGEAERQYRAAAALAEGGASMAEAEALERLGRALEAQSLPDKELEVLEEAARLYHAAGDLGGEGRVTAGIGSALMHLGNPAAAIARLESMLAALEAEGPSTVSARLSLQLGAILYGSGRIVECLPFMESARDVGRSV